MSTYKWARSRSFVSNCSAARMLVHDNWSAKPKTYQIATLGFCHLNTAIRYHHHEIAVGRHHVLGFWEVIILGSHF